MKVNSEVRVWEEKVVIPTYGVGLPEKNPMFLEKRVYQGSSGVVYPYPVIEKILNEKEDRSYNALFLENRYLKIMVLPELGGRIQIAFDKIRNRHFIYHNNVIKPALVGLTGPWISGGIEFNWPQHHRPSTFDPVDFALEEHEDGSKSIYVSEVERMFRTKGMAGIRMYPDKAYFEVNVKLFNRTPFPQTFLWWANPAVKANDHYQTVFPPDIHAVFDHGKRAVSEFPIAKGTYYNVDYSRGVDISRYKNIPVPTSYMAIRSRYDFMGGYEHDSKAGILHVADHHISPGKKQWTWGNGDFGHAWDRNLTDCDGPYVELMTGVFTDNQPDFSWIQPNEERTFTQYFMPYSEIGIVKNATKDAMVNLEIRDHEIIVMHYATSRFEKAEAILTYDGKKLFSEVIDISPESPSIRSVPTHEKITAEKLRATLQTADGKLLVAYQPEEPTEKIVPEPVQPANDPNEIESIEELYLTGLHIEQYRHATRNATQYYLEALRRDPDDTRNSNAMGLWLLRRGQFKRAEPYLTRAISVLTGRNPNPNDCEPYFHLGTCLFMQGRNEEAYEAWYKSAWSASWQDAAYLNLARIATADNSYELALSLIEKSLNRNWSSQSARHLKVILLRKSRQPEQAEQLIKETLEMDRFNGGCLYEDYLLTAEKNPEHAEIKLKKLKRILRNNVQTHIEYAFDYAHAGLYREASDFLLLTITDRSNSDPMAYYYLGYFALRLKLETQANMHFRKASESKPDYCFPNRIEDVTILETAIALNCNDSKAPYYLGNFWYANRQYSKAIEMWETSRKIDETFPTVHRNLALAYHNKLGKTQQALRSLDQAFQLDTTDARVLMELDQLYKKVNKPHRERLAMLTRHKALVYHRDDLYLEWITLYNHIGEYGKAKQLIADRKFHPWEGGEGKVIAQHLICHTELAKLAINAGQHTTALRLLDEVDPYPENLGEGKLYGTVHNDVLYLKGCASEGAGLHQQAAEHFREATAGPDNLMQAVYYNDPQPYRIFYQAMAYRKCGNDEKAKSIFERLVAFGRKHIDDKIKIDYFAVSLPDLLVFDHDLDLRNRVHCHYLIGLGYLGQGFAKDAEMHFDIVLQHDINHFGAALHKKMIHNRLLAALPT